MAKKNKSNKVTKLKLYLLQNNIEQLDIHRWTKLSMGAVNKLVGTGKGNNSTKLLVQLFLKSKTKGMNNDRFEELLTLIPQTEMYREIK